MLPCKNCFKNRYCKQILLKHSNPMISLMLEAPFNYSAVYLLLRMCPLLGSYISPDVFTEFVKNSPEVPFPESNPDPKVKDMFEYYSSL